METTSAVLGGTISNQLIGDLPVQGRNFTKLLELRPGVYLAPGSGKWSQSSKGMRREHNVYILNGIDTIEGFSSQSVVNATGVFGDATSNTKFAASTATPDVQVSNPSVGSGAARGFQMGLKLSF